MYIRMTQRKNRDGSVVRYYQLAHNKREPGTGKIVPQILFNFGRAEELDREGLARLSRSIAKVCGMSASEAVPCEGKAASVPTQNCVPKDLTILSSRELGTAYVIEALWERLGIGALIRRIAQESQCTVPYERAIFAMTANRLCEPQSKLGVWDRWLPKMYLPSCWALKLAQMYEAMDLLYAHSARIEEAVFFKAAELLSLEVDLVFYDTTTASFQIDLADDEANGREGMLRNRGHSKDGTWSPQIVVALAVTREGVPIRSWVFPGDTTDVNTVEKVKADLRSWKIGRALFVADGGMDSEKNRKILSQACGRYLLAARAASVKEIREEVLTRAGRYKKISDNLHIKEVTVGNGELRRRYILCFNPKEAQRQKSHRDEVVSELKEELGRHKSWDAKAKWAIKFLASPRTSRYLSISSAGMIHLDSSKVAEAEKFDGKWVLITNDDTLTIQDAACGYKSLLVIERCFRTLKTTEIHLEPINHWLPRRIESHVKICMLALLIQRTAELTSKERWSDLHGLLAKLQAIEFSTPTHRFFQRNEMEEKLVKILEVLSIDAPKPVLAIEEIKV